MIQGVVGQPAGQIEQCGPIVLPQGTEPHDPAVADDYVRCPHFRIDKLLLAHIISVSVEIFTIRLCVVAGAGPWTLSVASFHNDDVSTAGRQK